MNPILKTKLFIPTFNQTNVLNRPRLTHHLTNSIEKKLTIVSAPAGFGKTTCLAQWIKTLPQPVGWISLNNSDNDPSVFWTYFIAAFQKLKLKIDPSALEMLQKTDIEQSVNLLITTLINDMVESNTKFIIILDDYHLIKNKTIHNSIKFFIKNAPDKFHLVISSRTVPPIAMSKMRIKGYLSEFYSDDLRFSSEEINRFFNDTMELGLDNKRLNNLITSSEGWVTGLQIVALALKTKPGRINDFSMDSSVNTINQHLMLYFIEEVLDNHSEEVRIFLIKTSILDRLSGSICDTVTGEQNSASILDELYKANIFITRIDEKKNWYRYHHLFTKALRAKLDQQLLPDQINGLHEKAYQWFFENNFPDESFQHAMHANHTQFAAKIIELNSLDCIRSGQFKKLLNWIKSLPSEILDENPVINNTYAWILVFSQFYSNRSESKNKKIKQLVKKTRKAYDKRFNGKNLPDDPDELLAYMLLPIYIECLQLLYVDKCDGIDSYEFIDKGNQLLDNLGQNPSGLHPIVSVQLAMEYRLIEDYDNAFKYYELGQSYALEAKDFLSYAGAVIGQASISQKKGALHKALIICRKADEYFTKRFFTTKETYADIFGFFNLSIARNLYEQDDLVNAKELLKDGLQKMRYYSVAYHIIEILALQLRIVLSQKHEKNEIAPLLSEIEYLERSCYKTSYFSASLRIYSILSSNNDDAHNIKAALEVAKEYLFILTENNRTFLIPNEKEWKFFAQLTLIRLYIIQARLLSPQSGIMKPKEILFFIETKLESAQSNKLNLVTIELLILKALVFSLMKDDEASESTLNQALILADPEEITRVFINEGKPMATLLKKIIIKKGANPFIQKVLDKIEAEQKIKIKPSGKEISSENQLFEQLSRRELEILKLLKNGLSNQEIADKLFLSISTIKWHNLNIYSKLGVNRRFHAILIAKELGLS